MYAKFFKRFFDFILSLCAVIVLSPILLVLIVLGTIFMRGNPFFFQERPGKDEKIFKLSPDHVRPELLHGAGDHRAAPYDRTRFLIQQQVHGNHFDARLRLKG